MERVGIQLNLETNASQIKGEIDQTTQSLEKLIAADSKFEPFLEAQKQRTKEKQLSFIDPYRTSDSGEIHKNPFIQPTVEKITEKVVKEHTKEKEIEREIVKYKGDEQKFAVDNGNEHKRPVEKERLEFRPLIEPAKQYNSFVEEAVGREPQEFFPFIEKEDEHKAFSATQDNYISLVESGDKKNSDVPELKNIFRRVEPVIKDDIALSEMPEMIWQNNAKENIDETSKSFLERNYPKSVLENKNTIIEKRNLIEEPKREEKRNFIEEPKREEKRNFIEEPKREEKRNLIEPSEYKSFLFSAVNEGEHKDSEQLVNPNPEKAIIEGEKENTEALVSAIEKVEKGVREHENPNNLPVPTDRNPQNEPNNPRHLPHKPMPNNDRMKSIYKAITGGAAYIAANKFVDSALGVSQGVIGAVDSNRRKRVSVLQGDVYGAQQNEINRNLNIEKSVSSGIMATAIGVGAIWGPIGALIGAAAGGIIKSISDKIGSQIAEEKKSEIQFDSAMSGMYKDILPVSERSISSFYDRSSASMWGQTDEDFFRERGGTVRKLFARQAEDTGLDLNEFGNYTLELSKQGIGYNNPKKAADLTRQAALYARYTDGDVGQFNSFLGTVSRYGKENADSLDYAYGAGKLSGLQNGQFGEFLQGVESVIERGISKGFISSTKEVSGTLLGLSRLSDNSEFWKGEQGSQRLNQINAGIENATALNDSTQVLAYRAFRDATGGSELETLAAMEKGITSPEEFNKLSEYAKNTYGDDQLSNVMFWKNLTGLGWNDSIKLVEMQNRAVEGKNVTQEEIDDVIREKPENLVYKSDSSNLVNLQNEMKAMASEFGVDYFKQELTDLNSYTEEIRNELLERKEKKESSVIKEPVKTKQEKAVETTVKEMEDKGVPSWGRSSRAVAETIRGEESAANLGIRTARKELGKNKNSDLASLSDKNSEMSKKVNEFVKAVSAESGLSENVELARVLRYTNEIVHSREDSDTSNDKYINDYAPRYSGVLSVILESLLKLNDTMEGVERNTREVEGVIN